MLSRLTVPQARGAQLRSGHHVFDLAIVKLYSTNPSQRLVKSLARYAVVSWSNMSVILYVRLNVASKDSLELLLAQQNPSIAERFPTLQGDHPGPTSIT